MIATHETKDTTEAIVAELNRAYAGEWLCAFACNYMGVAFTGRPGAGNLGGHLIEAADADFVHQRLLGQRIMALGGRPLGDIAVLADLSRDEYPSLPKETDFDATVKTVVGIKRQAIERYQQAAKLAHVSDPVTYLLVAQIMAEEYEHIGHLARLVTW